MDFFLSKLGTVVSFIIIFTVVVVVHEFGHYLLGRLNGIKVNEFSIGMGPAIFKKKLKNTRLVIRLLPIGGACVFEGEDGNYENQPEEELVEEKLVEKKLVEQKLVEDELAKEELAEKESFNKIEEDSDQIPFNKAPLWGRIATVFAGPFFNVILAYLLAIFICWFCGQDIPILYSVTDGLPAQQAGMEAGDKIVKINGERIYVWREISVLSLLSSGKSIDIVYERDGQRYNTTLTPYYSAEEDRYYFGFVGGGDFIPCNNIGVFKYAWFEVRHWLITTVRSLEYMVSGRASADDVSGPVGIATVIDDTIEETSSYGFFTVFLNLCNITLLLSVNLGVMNLLPIPALDGGRLLFFFVELVRGKPIPPEKEGIIHVIGFILLMALMVFVFYNDIMKLIH